MRICRRLQQACLLALVPVVAASAEADLDAAFRRATKLLEPYIVLTDRSATEARTPDGRAKIAEAVGLLNGVTAASPNDWPSFWFIGKAHQALRDHPAAYAAFKQSLALRPPNPNVAREFVIEAICVRATSEAVAAAQEVAQANPSNSGLQANLGLALLANGQLDEAQAVTERALGMAPTDGITKALLAEIASVRSGRPPSEYCPP